jgi:hypothetical protein
MNSKEQKVEPTTEPAIVGNTVLPAVLEDEVYETELNNYLNDGINYGANTIKNADIGDLQQLAADSFFYGYLLAVQRFKNGT